MKPTNFIELPPAEDKENSSKVDNLPLQVDIQHEIISLPKPHHI